MGNESGYTIRFAFPPDDGSGVVYAGRTPDGALAFAPTLATAEVWATATVAGNFLANGYGNAYARIGSVVRVEDGVEVAFDVREYDVTSAGELEPAS